MDPVQEKKDLFADLERICNLHFDCRVARFRYCTILELQIIGLTDLKKEKI